MRLHASLSSLLLIALSGYVAATGIANGRSDLTAVDASSSTQWLDAPPTYEEAMDAAVNDLHDFVVRFRESRGRSSRRTDTSSASQSASQPRSTAIGTAPAQSTMQIPSSLLDSVDPARYKISNIEHAFLDPREHDRLSMTGSDEEKAQIRNIVARIVKRKLQESGTPGFPLRDHVDARHPYSLTRLLEDLDRWTFEITQLQSQWPATVAEFTNRNRQVKERCQMMAQMFVTAKQILKPGVFDLLQRFYMVNVCTAYRL